MIARIFFLLLPLVFSFNSFAKQDVITVFPDGGDFKFVWSGTSAVYKSKDGTVTVRCTFDDNFNGVDDDAEPYVATSFLCKNGITFMLKQQKKKQQTWVMLLDKEGKQLGESTPVNLSKESY